MADDILSINLLLLHALLFTMDEGQLHVLCDCFIPIFKMVCLMFHVIM